MQKPKARKQSVNELNELKALTGDDYRNAIATGGRENVLPDWFDKTTTGAKFIRMIRLRECCSFCNGTPTFLLHVATRNYLLCDQCAKVILRYSQGKVLWPKTK